MKKTTKKLRLEIQTIRALVDDTLGEVRGGLVLTGPFATLTCGSQQATVSCNQQNSCGTGPSIVISGNNC
jgi:hypothetical protein